MELGGLPLRKCNFNLGGVGVDIRLQYAHYPAG